MSRIFRSDDITTGDRIIVRRKLADGHFSDIIGHVTALEPLTVRPQRVGGFPSAAAEVEIPAEIIHIVKKLSPRTIRNSEIRHVEEVSASAYPGQHERWTSDGGWFMRAGDGETHRTNSAVPLGPNAGFNPVPIEEIAEFYASHSLPTLLLIPERIAKSAVKLPSLRFGEEKLVMTRSLDDLSDLDSGLSDPVTLASSDTPCPEWVELNGAPDSDLNRLPLHSDPETNVLRYFSVNDFAAIVRASITTAGDGSRWLGLASVKVSKDSRRQGLGGTLCTHVLRWAAGLEADGNGEILAPVLRADHAYLQVAEGNDAAQMLYEKIGFIEHHRHRFATYHG
ncbi:MAG: GNAT family N-acetyltransferase [Corynebacterium sp.]|nr:GNAT family N-acetyltransferase [Corynebacterium sp.]